MSDTSTVEYEYAQFLIEQAAADSDPQLDLAGLELAAVPPEIAALTHLTHLSLRNNKLTQLPDSLKTLTNLVQLSVADNQLVTLPAFLDELAALERLNAKNNRIRELPPALFELDRLELLHLAGNRLDIPADILGKYDRPAEILRYYRLHCYEAPQPPPLSLGEIVARELNPIQLTFLARDLCVPEDIYGHLLTHDERAAAITDYHIQHGLEEEFRELLYIIQPNYAAWR